MIYSVKLQKEIPITVEKKMYDITDYGKFTQYVVKDGKIPVGTVDLQDTINGVEVLYIKSQLPNRYRHFGEIADQIEVEHCLNRGIENPYIKSVAALGSHIMHFKRGKRYVNEGLNIYFENLVPSLLKGERITTHGFGAQPMFMPQNLVSKYKEIIKKMPLLKGVK